MQQQLTVQGETSQSPAKIVSEARRALDRAGDVFATQTSDPALQKAGIWLLEMIKTTTAVLDQGAEAHIIWQETAPPWYKRKGGLQRSLFFGAAGLFALTGFVQGQGLVILCAGVLAGVSMFDSRLWSGVAARLPFIKRPPALEDMSGRHVQAEARIRANAVGFIDTLTDSLKTADHILLRLSEPEAQTHWRDNARLMSLVQGLLEARHADDGDFALKLVGQELETILAAENIRLVTYTAKQKHLFDELPSLEEDGMRDAAPALLHGDTVIRRGTVWRGS